MVNITVPFIHFSGGLVLQEITTPTPSLKILFHLFVALNKTIYRTAEDDMNGLSRQQSFS